MEKLQRRQIFLNKENQGILNDINNYFNENEELVKSCDKIYNQIKLCEIAIKNLEIDYKDNNDDYVFYKKYYNNKLDQLKSSYNLSMLKKLNQTLCKNIIKYIKEYFKLSDDTIRGTYELIMNSKMDKKNSIGMIYIDEIVNLEKILLLTIPSAIYELHNMYSILEEYEYAHNKKYAILYADHSIRYPDQ